LDAAGGASSYAPVQRRLRVSILVSACHGQAMAAAPEDIRELLVHHPVTMDSLRADVVVFSRSRRRPD
jgi:hypothetical protein